MRLGLVAFSNAAPLTLDLPPAATRRGTPSEVSDWLVTGEVDVALLPTIELGRMPGVTALPRWGVAADGRCESVLLFSRRLPPDVRRVTLDAASRTSAALTRILLEREGALGVEYVRREGGTVEERLEEADATLLIGDPALVAEAPDDVTIHDLAREWKRHVGLPFVFATWAARPGHDLSSEEIALLDAAAESGLARQDEIADAEAARLGLPPDRMRRYFGHLQYRLDVDHLRGVRAFLDEAHRIGILPERPDVKFLA